GYAGKPPAPRPEHSAPSGHSSFGRREDRAPQERASGGASGSRMDVSGKPDRRVVAEVMAVPSRRHRPGPAEQAGPAPSSQTRLTGQGRPAPRRVADGDGMGHPPGIWRVRARKNQARRAPRRAAGNARSANSVHSYGG